MKRLATIRGGVAIVLMLGIVVAVTSNADASSSGQLGAYMRQGLSLKRAQVALETQTQVEAVELPSRLEKALGASFAGMWFEPSTGKFCIGVVSGASRRAAEQLVAQTGVASIVSYVSVRSTWAQLLSAQGEWNAKLAHFGIQQFSTYLTAAQNAVSVTLSSSVPENERALLEREAASFHVNVSITVVPPQALVLEARNSQCEIKPRESYAFCSKPIAAGVLITPTADRKGYCTAGPLAILSSPATLAAELETLLITAGHCLATAEKWFTATHPGNELSEIGPRIEFKNGLPGDYGDILVGPNWLQAGVTPALAQITHYQDNGLREARSVVGEEASVLNASFCKQGATSAEQCGIITGLNKLGVFSGTHVEGLVKTNACGERGDSGGPYATLPSGNTVRILGTEVGGPEEKCSGLFCQTTCESSYEPIRTSLTGLGLTLLTTANQTRHRCAAVMPCYLTESLESIASLLKILATHAGNATLTTKVAGIAVEISCENEHDTGWIENSTTTGMGLSYALIHFLQCIVPKPAGKGCKVNNELIHLAAHDLLLLASGEGFKDEFVPNVGTEFASVTIEGCTGAAVVLNGTFALSGSATATVNNSASELEFTGTSGSNLKFGANEATYIDTVKIEMEGGGGIKVGA